MPDLNRDLHLEHLRAELTAFPRGRQLLCVRNLRRFRDRAFCDYLLRHSWSLRFADPAAMLWEARIAQAAADAGGHDELRVLARIQVANALRIVGRFKAAEQALSESLLLEERVGLQSDLLRAERLSVLASTRYAQGRSEEGTTAVREAITHYERSGDNERLASLLVQLALNVSDSAPIEALQLITRATQLMGPDNLRLRLIAHHNAAECLYMMGKVEHAARVIEGLNELYELIGEPVIQARRYHLAAQVAAQLGFSGLAEERYNAAIHLYRTTSNHHYLAGAALELAAMLLPGQPAKAARWVQTAITNLDLVEEGEFIESVAALRSAAETDSVGVDLLLATAARLLGRSH
jgi:tetratricopeptide (TPR) repeat protein